MTHAQAVSLAHKVRVNAVLPGWIDTIGKPEDITQQDHDWHLTGAALTGYESDQLTVRFACFA